MLFFASQGSQQQLSWKNKAHKEVCARVLQKGGGANLMHCTSNPDLLDSNRERMKHELAFPLCP